jgi:hypothetical protein
MICVVEMETLRLDDSNSPSVMKKRTCKSLIMFIVESEELRFQLFTLTLM